MGAERGQRDVGDDVHPIVAEELALLASVSTLLRTLPAPTPPDEEPLVRELERLREQLLARRDGKDAVALNEQWHRQSALLRQLRLSREAPEVDARSPYFAHLRLRENGVERDLCLGRATRIDGGLRIVDWRHAPVSRIFYRYDQGDEYEEEFAGRVRSGRVQARRTLVIRNACLERVEAPEGVFSSDARAPGGWRRTARGSPRLAGGEGAALRFHDPGGVRGRSLGGRPSGSSPRQDRRLSEITSLIDPGQFDVITRPSAGFLLIRGAAGSGKTTVALHRIAYLAYADPGIDSRDTLFVVFNPALRRYVEHVLPALGVERVRICTYLEWAARQRRRHFPALPDEPRPDTSALAQRIKLHPALGRALEEHVRRVPGPATAEQALDDWASLLSQPAPLEEAFGRQAPGEVSAADLGRFVERERRQNEALFGALAGGREAHAALDPEDDALLLRCWQLRVGPLRGGGRPLAYRHVAIDEVQDFAPVEVRVLLDCLDERRSLTLAGDAQQHLSAAGGFTSWGPFLADLGIAGSEMETLRISHRSTAPIVAFAQAVLGPLREAEGEPEAKRSGPPVECFPFTDRGACVAFLAGALRGLAEREPFASVAVLAPDREAGDLYHQGLAAGDVPRLRRVADQDFTFAPGIEVSEIAQAKGLEFDYVILIDVDEESFPDRPSARRLLHVGATRAIHQLWVAYVGTPSPLLPSSG